MVILYQKQSQQCDKGKVSNVIEAKSAM